jgi:hypothetical protein
MYPAHSVRAAKKSLTLVEFMDPVSVPRSWRRMRAPKGRQFAQRRAKPWYSGDTTITFCSR